MRVLIVANYIPDAQESMLRFAGLLGRELAGRGVPCAVIRPEPIINRWPSLPGPIRKWLAYADKYLLFPARLRAVSNQHDLVHIADQSNAVYLSAVTAPAVVTCHDLMAARGALGEDTACPASPAGKLLQRWVLSSLRRARTIACASTKTLADVRRLVGTEEAGRRSLHLVFEGMNHPYRRLDSREARLRLEGYPQLAAGEPFVLHVGSSELRKNRQGAIRGFALASAGFTGRLVFAGDALTRADWRLAADLGVAARVVEVVKPSNDVLEALYNCARALVMPSIAEGFGWPVIEAQSCGCPVICSNREPLIEVSGGAATFVEPRSADELAAAIVAVSDPSLRDGLSAAGLSNARRFSPARMIDSYLSIYGEALAAVSSAPSS